MKTWLEGKKTYIVAVAIGAVTIAQQLGWITTETAVALYGVLGAGGLAALRAGITKVKP